MAPTWQLIELVAHGVGRCAEAQNRWQPAGFIFVEELYQGSTRISNRIEQFESIIKFMAADAREHHRAYCILKFSDNGWIVDDYGNCLGDRIDVNAHLGEIRRGAA